MFVEFPKIPRLNREIIVTEKIDGTNAHVWIELWDVYVHNLGHTSGWPTDQEYMRVELDGFDYVMAAGSRTRWLSHKEDNHGFWKWVDANKNELARMGPGRHYGEWWGSGIQRGYGLVKGEKRFSLFNVERWGDQATRPTCCHVVPLIARGPFKIDLIDGCVDDLRTNGSLASPGFMRPEGVIIFHTASRHLYKVTLEKDDVPKHSRQS